MCRNGFNAVVSNPPFTGGTFISGRLGKDVLSFLGNFIAQGKTAGGRADLCSYFLLRNMAIAHAGRVGIIATDTIAQGDTREVGLDRAVDSGWAIYRANKSQRWPGSASLQVSLLWTGHPQKYEIRILDGYAAGGITSSLDPESRVSGIARSLAASSGQSFKGCEPIGNALILRPDIAREMLERRLNNRAVIMPYLNADDLNSHSDCSASRWIINFGQMTEEEARRYPECWSYGEQHVLPERLKLSASSYPGLAKRWWQYWRPRPQMWQAIADFDRVLVIARHSPTGMPVFVTSRQVMSDATVVFASDRYEFLALMSSSIHFVWWTTKGESTLGAGSLRYTLTDGFETFSQPRNIDHMRREGEKFDTFRRTLMERRDLGLTDVYNLVNSDSEVDSEILTLRGLHADIDEAVREAYALDEEREPSIREHESMIASAPLPSWREIPLSHGIYETRQGKRYTIGPQARIDVLDKLLALNHYRHELEVKQGLHSGRGRGVPRKKAARARTDGGTAFDDGTLFKPEGTLF